MKSTSQETKILQFLQLSVFGVPAQLSDIRFVFRNCNSFFVLDADKAINEFNRFYPLIFDLNSYKPDLSSSDKTDIHIVLHDQRTRMNSNFGFSIKSQLGQPATLFNPAAGTNFIYRVEFPDGIDVDCDTFNQETYNPEKPNTINPFTGKANTANKICGRVQRIEELGGKIIFDHIQSECLTQNLRTIDSEMPTIMANALLLRYRYRVNNWEHILKFLNEINPLNYRISDKSPVYEYKIKRFLYDSALGMVSDEPWDGNYDATGGQIIVRHDGDIVCYHVCQLNKYLDYLLSSTELEQTSTSEDENNPGHPRPNPKKRFFFGWLYKENGIYYIKFNLQVRFKRVSKKKKK